MIHHQNYRVTISRRLRRSSWDWKIEERQKLGLWVTQEKGKGSSRQDGKARAVRALKVIIENMREEIRGILQIELPDTDMEHEGTNIL
jgi:hypothetical protein